MKRIILITAVTVLLTLAFEKNYAQDQWVQGKSGIYSAGIGGTQGIGLYRGYHAVSPVGLSLNFSGEYKVYEFIGLGFQTGLNFYFSYGPASYIGIPIAIKANVHILDAIGGIAIADKLDVYGGLNLGGGPAFGTYQGAPVIGFLQVGPQVGARYWLGKVAIFGEFGWGATFANVGVTF